MNGRSELVLRRVLWALGAAVALSVVPFLSGLLGALMLFVILLLVDGGGLWSRVKRLALGAGVASNIDNVARLFVYRRVSGIHPMLTLVGAFAGVRLFGVIGAFLGPLVPSYFVELVSMYEGVRTSSVSIPINVHS